MKWILKYILRLPAKKLSNIALTVLKEVAKRTDNKFDDEAVEVIEAIIEEAFAG